MNSSDYADSSQEYETLYPQTVMETDSQDSPGHDGTPFFYSPGQTKDFNCFCGKIFTSKADFNRHVLVHTGERPHECDICGKSFSLKGNLTKHMLLHNEEKAYHCPECGKSFLKKGYIDQHMRVHTGEKPFICQHCDRAFSLKGNLVQHMKLHTDEKSYHCLECSKVFLKKSYLMQHMRIHSGEKPHKCTLCSRAFILKGNLMQHMMRHSGHKPFKCQECEKAFALKSALKEHEKVHGGEKPFVCNVCSKAFNKKSYLVQHERTHTGERPFHCIECNKSFSQRSILNQHMKQHGERSYKCTECRKIFLKKLVDINRSLQKAPFSGFKCSDCEDAEQLSGMFMKQEEPMVNYNSQSYMHDGNMAVYDLDNTTKPPQEGEKMRMIKMQMSDEYPESSCGKIYDFNPEHAHSSHQANMQKFMDYNQKKGDMLKEHDKTDNSNLGKTNCGSSSEGVGAVEEFRNKDMKDEATYTELRVIGNDGQVNVGNNVPQVSGMVGKPVASTSLLDDGSQKQLSGGIKESDCFNQERPISAKNISNLKEHPDPSTNNQSCSISEKSIEKDNHQTIKFKKSVPTPSVMEESEVRRTLPSLPDYNTRPVDFRYIENLRDPFQRNYTNLRHGNMPDMENPLSRFGIKGYYNAHPQWSLTGNYPQ